MSRVCSVQGMSVDIAIDLDEGESTDEKRNIL